MSQQQESNLRSISSPEIYYCWRCGTPWPAILIVCESCGGTDRARGTARPTEEIVGDAEHYSGPWQLLPWPRQGAVCVWGGPGSGKSSLATLVRPTAWLTKEQEPKPAGAMFRRITPGNIPQIHVVNDAADVKCVLDQTESGPVVTDSLSAFGLREALVVAHLMLAWAKQRNDRALGIMQVNSKGEAQGYTEIPHLFDAVIGIFPDPMGVRTFQVVKSRWSAQESTCWTFDKQGQVSVPTFPAAYSVEGLPGNYYLHPFPMRGAKWNGLLAALDAIEKLRPRCASAAIPASYMPNRFLEPPDAAERRRFAERSGLRWLEPSRLIDTLREADSYEE